MQAYQRVGKLSSLYDGMMTNSSFLGRLAIRYFWQLSDIQYIEFINQAFAGIPNDFAGSLLEVPIGTGVLSLPLYKDLPATEIISRTAHYIIGDKIVFVAYLFFEIK